MERETTGGTILTPDGEMAQIDTVVLTTEEAAILRSYKKFLHAHGLKEAIYCDKCWNRELSDGCHAFVTTNQILIRCRCTQRFYQGMSV